MIKSAGILTWKADSSSLAAAAGSTEWADEKTPLISLLQEVVFTISILRLEIFPVAMSLRDGALRPMYGVSEGRA